MDSSITRLLIPYYGFFYLGGSRGDGTGAASEGRCWLSIVNYLVCLYTFFSNLICRYCTIKGEASSINRSIVLFKDNKILDKFGIIPIFWLILPMGSSVLDTQVRSTHPSHCTDL
jgi:hypothetical protein